jgi:hypothetical protein
MGPEVHISPQVSMVYNIISRQVNSSFADFVFWAIFCQMENVVFKGPGDNGENFVYF